MAAIACRTRNSDSCNRRFNSWLVTVRRGASPPPFVYYKYKGVLSMKKSQIFIITIQLVTLGVIILSIVRKWNCG